MLAPLLKAVRDELRKNLRPLGVEKESVEVTPDEKVTAIVGQVAVSIYSIDISPASISGNAILVTDLAIAVGATLRVREIPVDRRGVESITDIGNSSQISLDEIIQRIVRSIHGRPAIVQKATEYGEKLGIVYCEPLFLARSISTAEEKGPDHFNISENANSDVQYNETDIEALYQEVVFQGAKCFQAALDFEPELD